MTRDIGKAIEIYDADLKSRLISLFEKLSDYTHSDEIKNKSKELGLELNKENFLTIINSFHNPSQVITQMETFLQEYAYYSKLIEDTQIIFDKNKYKNLMEWYDLK